MGKCSKYVSRFKKALAFRKLEFPNDIIDMMAKRAKSDGSLDLILNQTIQILEPPACTKSHCPHFTTFSFCNCSIDRVPGKCPLYLQYRRGVKQRKEKKFQARLKQIPKKFLPLSPENEKRVREADEYTWAKFLRRKH